MNSKRYLHLLLNNEPIVPSFQNSNFQDYVEGRIIDIPRCKRTLVLTPNVKKLNIRFIYFLFASYTICLMVVVMITFVQTRFYKKPSKCRDICTHQFQKEENTNLKLERDHRQTNLEFQRGLNRPKCTIYYELLKHLIMMLTEIKLAVFSDAQVHNIASQHKTLLVTIVEYSYFIY